MIVEKYTKALMNALDEKKIVEIYEAMKKVAAVANNPKFVLIVKSPLLSIDEKIKFLTDLAQNDDPKLINFFKILLVNKRIDIIKEITQNLYENVSKKLNTYYGVVEGKVDNDTLNQLEKKLSEKFNATIKLQLKESELNGVRVFVDVLNVEVGLDENKIKRDLLNQILKAI